MGPQFESVVVVLTARGDDGGRDGGDQHRDAEQDVGDRLEIIPDEVSCGFGCQDECVHGSGG